jgi:micrococcal nuclease
LTKLSQFGNFRQNESAKDSGFLMTFRRIFLLFSIFFYLPPGSAEAKTLSGKVLKVFDGDTILVRVHTREENVRLREIDAPELTREKRMGQEPWGKQAKEYAQALLKGKGVRLEIEEENERDKFQRLLAYVFIDRTFVNRELVRSGKAFHYPGPIKGKYARELAEAEEEAKKKGLGVWHKERGLKERPHEFRARTQRDEILFTPAKEMMRKEKPKASAEKFPLPPDKIVGNKRSMIYHAPGTPEAARVHPKNRIFFNSAEEAEKAGFRRSKSEEGRR